MGLTPYFYYSPELGSSGAEVDLLRVVGRHLGFTYRLRRERAIFARDPGDPRTLLGTVGHVRSRTGLPVRFMCCT